MSAVTGRVEVTGKPLAGELVSGDWALAAMTPPQRRKRLKELGVWLVWLINTFELQAVVPPCWYLHDGLTERLNGLFVDWARNYSVGDSAGKPGAGPLRWLEALDRQLPRLTVKGDCLLTQHTENPLETRPVWRNDAGLIRWVSTPGNVVPTHDPFAPVTAAAVAAQEHTMDQAAMQQLINRGEAKPFLAGSLVRYADTWWLGDGARYLVLGARELTEDLEAQIPRLQRAIAAATGYTGHPESPQASEPSRGSGVIP